jgi:hypothetical protein
MLQVGDGREHGGHEYYSTYNPPLSVSSLVAAQTANRFLNCGKRTHMGLPSYASSSTGDRLMIQSH